MKTVRKPSVVPVYAVAAVWIVYTLLFGLHSVAQLLVCAAISAAVYLLVKVPFPGKTVQVETPEKPPDTGDAELDEVILKGRESIRQIRRLNEKIPGAQVSRQLSRIEDVTGKIFRRLEEDRQAVRQCRQFLNYYLPTTIRLLEQYVRLQDQGLRSGSVAEGMDKIEAMLNKIELAFGKQLESLFDSAVVDITADIAVMEQMMKTQGLTDEKEL